MIEIDRLTFDERGLIPAVVQDVTTDEVLMLAYMNEESLERTIATGETHFWSRSRNQLWRKGETSGNSQAIEEIRFDCDADALLVRVRQRGVACHTGKRSCFHRTLVDPREPEAGVRCASAAILDELFTVIRDRKENPHPDSYTAKLFATGVERILKKVGEEAAEVIIAAMGGDPDEIVYESADLLYHLLVLLASCAIEPAAVYAEIGRRRRR